MVDPTKGIGSLQGLISGTRVTESAPGKRTGDTKESSRQKDEISLSPQALNAKQADDASTQVRSLLESDESLTLSKGEGFDESL